MSILPLPRSSAGIERVADRPALLSMRALSSVNRMDGWTKIVAFRDASGWHRVSLRWSRSTVERMRERRARDVLISRFGRRARLPMSWLPVREGGD